MCENVCVVLFSIIQILSLFSLFVNSLCQVQVMRETYCGTIGLAPLAAPGTGAGRLGGSALPPKFTPNLFRLFMTVEAVLKADIMFCGVTVNWKPLLCAAAGGVCCGCIGGCCWYDWVGAGAGGAGRELGAVGARLGLLGLTGRLKCKKETNSIT